MSNRLTKIGILIVVSHSLLIFFSVFNKILVNYIQRGQRVRKESDYRQRLKVRVTGCEARGKFLATIRQITCSSDFMSRLLKVKDERYE